MQTAGMTTNHTDQSPDEHHERSTPDQHGTGPAPATARASAAPAWRRKRVWVAAVVVALLAGGAGVAYAVDELRDDDRSWSAADDRDRDDYRDRDDRDRDDYGDRDRDDHDDRDRDGRASTGTRDATQAGPGTPSTGPADQRDVRRDADDVPLTDAEIASVTDAALAEAGGGTVTDVDRSDDLDHAFEVDVLLADGDELEVDLAEDFSVVRTWLDPADRD